MDSEFPSLFKQAASLGVDLGKAALHKIQTGEGLVDQKTAQARFLICYPCDSLRDRDEVLARCKECGCYMRAKVTLVVSKCPLSKW